MIAKDYSTRVLLLEKMVEMRQVRGARGALPVVVFQGSAGVLGSLFEPNFSNAPKISRAFPDLATQLTARR
jgi:hypothetical protein